MICTFDATSNKTHDALNINFDDRIICKKKDN